MVSAYKWSIQKLGALEDRGLHAENT